MTRPFDPQSWEEKWQAVWAEEGLDRAVEDPEKEKRYILEMFPYPSGDIHMGHVRNYTLGDVLARYLRMQGFSVLHPIGWDSFGMPAENAAIQQGTHPAEWTYTNIERQRSSLKRMGFSYDWDRQVISSDEDYYRWGQWIFLKFWERGLVERESSPVNWCPHCDTVLANEQVIGDGVCWRCKSHVETRELEQWYFRITEYSDELLDSLDEMPGWPERVKTMQANWIGRSEGAEVDFAICDADGEPTCEKITVFTTRPDTLFGCSFFLLAPEHPLIDLFVEGTEHEEAVRQVQREAANRSAVDRETETEKHGAFTGRYVVDPVNGEKVPVWVSDYVLMEYGTGAVMAVPCGDQRDFEFARKYGLPIPPVVVPEDDPLAERLRGVENVEVADVDWVGAYDGPGVMVQSGGFTGMPGGKDSEGMKAVTAWLGERGLGRFKIQFRLRDWLISRQRYWGNPIPMIHCDACGWVPVPEGDLPVRLPLDVDVTKGETLADKPGFYEVECPKCGAAARRETDTMDTFTCSSWYYFRFSDARDDEAIWEKDKVDYWMPVDQYIGGIEHAILHLLYSRFFTKVFRDMGLCDFDEPFTRLLTQGMVRLDGFTMSKSRGNVVPPEEIIEKYGADVLRVYILFMAPPDKDLEWSTEGLEGVKRFLTRLWRLVNEAAAEIGACEPGEASAAPSGEERSVGARRVMHTRLKAITEDVATFSLNTAVARLMEVVNSAYDYRREVPEDRRDKAVVRESLEITTRALAPFAPHLAEQIWREVLCNDSSVHLQPWPVYDETAIEVDEVQYAVQVNGKVRARVTVPSDMPEAGIRDVALSQENVASHLEGKEIEKIVVVRGRLVSVVAK